MSVKKRSISWYYDLAQRVLRLWVRFRSYPETATHLGLLAEPGPPLVYFMQVRQLTDLLVLDEATQRLGLNSPFSPSPLDSRSGFYLSRTGQPSPLQRRPYRYSKRMLRLVKAVQSGQIAAVRIVPVSVFWGRAPEKQESALKALFSDDWGTPGPIRQLMRSILHGRQTLVKFGEPMLLDQASVQTEAAERRIARLLRAEFRRERELAIGPNLSHRQTLVNQLIESAPVQAAIAQEAADKQLALAKAELKARSIGVEIASDYSYSFIRFFDVLLTALWNRIYGGVALHRIETLTQISSGATVVYVPCHRSHIDYLLLSYVIHHQGLPVPHVAAGDNLNLPLVGSLLRKGGAFFLRRSFKGDKLYSTVFEQYLHQMITRGFPIEYFIEGGRSRTGRLLAPKAGMLAWTLESFMRDHTRPVVFVPVYIGYERVFEGSTYVAELSGQPKKRESIGGIIKALRSLRENFGKVHVNIGEPVRLQPFLDATQPDWRSSIERSTVAQLANTLVTRINDAVVLNPINLLALGLAGQQRHTVDADQLEIRIDLLRRLALAVPYSAQQHVTELDGKAVLAYAMDHRIISRRSHPLGDLIEIEPQQFVLLSYFRNNVLHAMAVPALLAALVNRNERIEPRRVLQTARSVFPFLKSEYFLSLDESSFELRLQSMLDAFIEQGLLKTSGAWVMPPALHESASIALHGLAQMLREPLERFAIVVGTLVRFGSGQITAKQLEDTSHSIAQRVALLHETSGPQFYDRAVLRAIIATLEQIGLTRVQVQPQAGALEFDPQLSSLAEQVMLLLPVETRISISHLSQPIQPEPIAP